MIKIESMEPADLVELIRAAQIGIEHMTEQGGLAFEVEAAGDGLAVLIRAANSFGLLNPKGNP